MNFVTFVNKPSYAVIFTCEVIEVSIVNHSIVASYNIYTVSQKTPHLWLAIIFTYAARLQQFLAKMLPRK